MEDYAGLAKKTADETQLSRFIRWLLNLIQISGSVCLIFNYPEQGNAPNLYR
jgi:hypothetical protein